MERIAIVTGANRGLGRELARGLARRGYRLILACRRLDAAREARDEIAAASGNGAVEAWELDLSSLASIRDFAAAFGRKVGRLNLLVNNAGLTSRESRRTADGFELIVGTNYFGTALLSLLLIPHFEAGAECRIVNLVSSIYRWGRFSFDKLGGYRWVKAYAVSKYALLLFSLELAERLRGRGISVNAIHPGVLRTTIMFTGRWYDPLIDALLLPFYLSPEEGAARVLSLADDDRWKGSSGLYFEGSRPRPLPPRWREGPERGELLRRTCAALGLGSEAEISL